MVENYLKCPISIFQLLAFSTNFCPIKIDLPGNAVWLQASSFQKKKSPKLTIYGIFHELMSALNVAF